MAVEQIDTVVVGGGQAGLALSEHLSANGLPHLILERDRIAERWRSARWDSLVANGPAWHDCFQSFEIANAAPDAFVHKDAMVDYFESYARHINAPIRCGVEVKRATRLHRRSGFLVETTSGTIEAKQIVIATGPFQKPIYPSLVPSDSAVAQMHSSAYRNPAQLPDGAVLVIGAGSSGVQIADELLRENRTVFLSVGPHNRPPRAYRGRDYCWWLGVLGLWDAETVEPGKEHVTIAVSGSHGGFTIDFRELASRGMNLLGMARDFSAGKMRFASDLAENIERGDADYISVLDAADRYIEDNGLDFPPEPQARVIAPAPLAMRDPVLELDLAEAGISQIIWATGYVTDFSWLEVDAFDSEGKPKHQRGVSFERGVYFLGLPWLSRRGSSFIWGVWHDAKFIADQIAKHNAYLNYRPSAD